MYNLKIKGGDHENDINHRDQLIRDMIYVCCLPNLSNKNRREFINVCVSWSFSDRAENDINRSAKYKGCPYWSEEALKRINDNGNWIDEKKDKDLRHEHIVPRRIFVEAIDEHFEVVRDEIKKGADIKKVVNREFEELQRLMNDNIKGCVITKEEAKTIDGNETGNLFKKDMPESAYAKNNKPDDKHPWERFSQITDAWARYRRVNKELTIYELDWKFNEQSKRWETDKTKKKCAF